MHKMSAHEFWVSLNASWKYILYIFIDDVIPLISYCVSHQYIPAKDQAPSSGYRSPQIFLLFGNYHNFLGKIVESFPIAFSIVL